MENNEQHNYQQLQDLLTTEINLERIFTEEAQLLAYGTDASLYNNDKA